LEPTLSLPIDAHRAHFCTLISKGPVVITSPTGSGKSTQVPRWCEGRVLVVEPRRIACRALATRVAELEGTRLGDAVGYSVRDERRATDRTRITFATPGIALRTLEQWPSYETIVLDEFHERGLETDLLLGVLRKRYRGKLVVMSATLEGDRVAAHVGGALLRAEGRMYPVEVKYGSDKTLLPSQDNLDARVRRALEHSRRDPGDVLVFLPGKAEIREVSRALRGDPDIELVELHGSLSLEEQSRAFRQTERRKVVLATNVAETSLTIPGIGVVIDGGLVRQTRYFQGRGHLMLVPIAQDSADQRAGRAGRTAPGVCYRLWSAAAKLAPVTAPEIYRESLVPLLLSAAACGETPEGLPLLDPAKDHAIATAREDLVALGALDPRGSITARGRALFELPLDAPLGRLLVEAESTGCLDDAIDLVCVLANGRPLFSRGPRPQDPADDLRACGCDVTATIRAVRGGDPFVHGLDRVALDEARRVRARLRKMYGLAAESVGPFEVDRARLARTALAADPRCVHVARRRGSELSFSNGGTEIELGRDSAVRGAEAVEAIAVLATRAFGDGRETRVEVTCATPLPLAWLVAAGLGRDRLGAVTVDRGRVLATVERVYARKVIDTREESPVGAVARAAIGELFVRGSVLKGSLPEAKQRLAAWALATQLRATGYRFDDESWPPLEPEHAELAAWVASRLESLGVESGEDLALLSPADLLPPELPYAAKAQFEKEYPLVVTVGDARYEVDYDVPARTATLRMVKGIRKDPPPLGYLPKFTGMKIIVEAGRSLWVLRERG
jgi:ATP-dependent helicase HrpB